MDAWKETNGRPAPLNRPLPLVSPQQNQPHPGCNIGGQRISSGGSALQSPCVSCICTSQGVSNS